MRKSLKTWDDHRIRCQNIRVNNLQRFRSCRNAAMGNLPPSPDICVRSPNTVAGPRVNRWNSVVASGIIISISSVEIDGGDWRVRPSSGKWWPPPEYSCKNRRGSHFDLPQRQHQIFPHLLPRLLWLLVIGGPQPQILFPCILHLITNECPHLGDRGRVDNDTASISLWEWPNWVRVIGS